MSLCLRALLSRCNAGDRKHTLDVYSQKKYCAKLLFIFLLGYDIEFGQMEAINLLSSTSFSAKQMVRDVGFCSVSVVLVPS